MKHYDKIFLIVALAVLGASVYYYFHMSPKVEKVESRAAELLAESAQGIVWKEIAVPELKISQIEWPEVRAQDEAGKWFFQVFTPPQIWVDRDGSFITESPYYKAIAQQAFALKYGGVSNEPYPVKYLGYFGTESEPVVQFVNTSNKLGFIGKLNQPITAQEPSTGKLLDLGLMVKSFKRERVHNKDNTISHLVTIVLFDKSLGKDITLYSDRQTVLLDQRRMTFNVSDGSQWHVKKAGEEKNIGGAKYIVKSLDFDKGEAIVQVIPSSEEIKPQTMKLSDKGTEPVK